MEKEAKIASIATAMHLKCQVLKKPPNRTKRYFRRKWRDDNQMFAMFQSSTKIELTLLSMGDFTDAISMGGWGVVFSFGVDLMNLLQNQNR